MRCTCAHARREARAEAFREAADWLADENERLLDGYQPRDAVAHFTVLADAEIARQPQRMDIVDCVEDDGFVTVHPPTWPSEDGGLDG